MAAARHTYDRSESSHLKGEIAADAVSRAGDEGNLARDATLLSREKAPPGDTDVNQEGLDDEDDDVEEVDHSAVEGDQAVKEGKIHKRDEPARKPVSSEVVESRRSAVSSIICIEIFARYTHAFLSLVS